MAMAESEVKHRHTFEQKALLGEITDTRVGQLSGLVIGCLVIICATYGALNGAETFAGVLAAMGLASLVSVFVMGRRKPE